MMIDPVGGSRRGEQVVDTGPERSRSQTGGADPAEQAAVDVQVSGGIGELPADVSDAIAAAAEATERLAAVGRQLHFNVDPASGALKIEMHDLDGNVLGTISPRRVLEIADGAPLDG